MIDVEPLIRRELARLVPHLDDGRGDWSDVVRRARGPLLRRPLALSLAAALALLAAAAALTASLGGFDDWLRGEPGKPASHGAQQRFEAANGRSWVSFPRGTNLRELIRTRAGGEAYVLYGFRSGNSLCLRLHAVALGKTTQACAPRATLERISAPILVVTGDWTFSDRRNAPAAEVSFGIVADGVSRVDVHATDGTHRAALGGNAYLFVGTEPNTANRVLRVSAVGPSGRRTAVALTSRFGFWFLEPRARRAPRGPTRIDVTIPHPTVGWHARGEKRGVAPGQVRLTADQRRFLGMSRPFSLGFTRLVKPDPLSDVVVGLTGNLCLVVFTGSDDGGAMGCSRGSRFFSRGPLNVMLSGGGSEFVAVAGVAADGVARVTLFLAGGGRQRVDLRDNLFAALVWQAEFPIRVVAYDRRGRVVAIETMSLRPVSRPVPAAAHVLRPLRRVRAPNGAVGVLRAGPVVRGYHCWEMRFSTGQAPGACMPPIGGGPKIWVDVVQPAGRDIFIVGQVNEVVSRVRLELGGDVRSTRPAAGHFVFAVPERYLRGRREHAFVVGIDRQGHRVQRQGVYFRMR